MQVLLEGETAYERDPEHPAWGNDGLLTTQMLRGAAELQVILLSRSYSFDDGR